MEIKNVEFSYGNHKVLNDISFKVQEGKITTIIGANGCGKSTLFNVITKNLKPQKGSVLLNGEDIKHISLKNFARQVAIVHQYNTAPSDITVEKLVSYGRIAHIDKGRRNYADDEKYINFAMEVTGVSEFAKKQISNLSGGQRQRVWIAMALAQKLNTEYGITIIMVLHDINQSIAYSDCIIAMKDGKILAEGNPNDVITEELIKNVYGIELSVKKIGENKIVLTV